MLTAKRSALQSKLDTLTATTHIVTEHQGKAQQANNVLEKRVNFTSQKRDNATLSSVNARNECMNKRATNKAQLTGDEDPCHQFKVAADSTVDATFQQAQESSAYFSASFLLKSDKQYQGFMQSRIAALKRQISELDTQLDNLTRSQVYLGEITELPELKTITDKNEEQDLNSQWLKFHYNSESSQTDTEQESHSEAVSVGVSIGLGPIGIGVSTSHGKSTTELKNAFIGADLKASGELMRVFIKRPWFKPSLFDNTVLNFVSHV